MLKCEVFFAALLAAEIQATDMDSDSGTVRSVAPTVTYMDLVPRYHSAAIALSCPCDSTMAVLSSLTTAQRKADSQGSLAKPAVVSTDKVSCMQRTQRTQRLLHAFTAPQTEGWATSAAVDYFI
jgi:hypothetical protein